MTKGEIGFGVSVALAFVALIVGITLWVQASQVTTREKIKARAVACASHHDTAREIGFCIQIAGH